MNLLLNMLNLKINVIPQDFLNKLNAKKYNTISHVQFTKKDVERHPVVADVLQIYDEAS